MIIELDNEELQFMSHEDIERSLADSTITIQIPLPNINVSNSYIDIIWDYLDASYVIEHISEQFKPIELKKKWGIKHFPVYHLKIENSDKKRLASTLKALIWSFQYPQNEDETEFNIHRDRVNEYEGYITEKKLAFPEVIDDFLMNLIGGAYYELEYETITDHLSSFPERNYGFISASRYNTSKEKILKSLNSWIVPSALNLDSVFNDNGYKDQISLLPSHLLMIDQKAVAISETGVVDIPMGQLLQAVECYEEYTAPIKEYRQRLDLDGSLFQHSPQVAHLQESYPGGLIKSPHQFKIYTSEFEDFCVVSIGIANIVLFDIAKTKHDESDKFINSTKQLISSIEDELITEACIDVDWEMFNDETFEELCYDIIYHNSKFDNSTIQKMGKSRSRDGGRDIVVFTKPLVNEEPKKYIFQCKLSGREKSINTTNVGSVSDVIDQYGAKGYGLMCNCYIDSTLFDRLEGIANHRNIENQNWSGFEVERFLSRRPLLKERYGIT